MIFSASAWAAESWLNSTRRNRCTPTKYFAASVSDSKYVMMGKALWPGVSRRFGKTAELILGGGAAGTTGSKSVNCGEILPNSYDLKQAGVCGTQVIVLLGEDRERSSDQYPSAKSQTLPQIALITLIYTVIYVLRVLQCSLKMRGGRG